MTCKTHVCGGVLTNDQKGSIFRSFLDLPNITKSPKYPEWPKKAKTRKRVFNTSLYVLFTLFEQKGHYWCFPYFGKKGSKRVLFMPSNRDIPDITDFTSEISDLMSISKIVAPKSWPRKMTTSQNPRSQNANLKISDPKMAKWQSPRMTSKWSILGHLEDPPTNDPFWRPNTRTWETWIYPKKGFHEWRVIW